MQSHLLKRQERKGARGGWIAILRHSLVLARSLSIYSLGYPYLPENRCANLCSIYRYAAMPLSTRRWATGAWRLHGALVLIDGGTWRSERHDTHCSGETSIYMPLAILQRGAYGFIGEVGVQVS